VMPVPASADLERRLAPGAGANTLLRKGPRHAERSEASAFFAENSG